VQGVPPPLWGFKLINEIMPEIEKYIIQTGRDVEENIKELPYFINLWNTFLKIRKIDSIDPVTKTTLGPVWGQGWTDVSSREQFYKRFSYSGWPGSSGTDAPLIAYDSLLWAWHLSCAQTKMPKEEQKVCDQSKVYETMMVYGSLHGGDSDSTGTMVGAWYGAMYGMEGVPKCNWEGLEYRERLTKLGEGIFAVAMAEAKNKISEEDFYTEEGKLNVKEIKGESKEDN